MRLLRCGHRTASAAIGRGTPLIALVLSGLAVVGCDARREPGVGQAAATAPRITTEVHPDFLYGRITDVDGAVYEGRLRWGRDQEAFWSDYFNGTKVANPWAVHAPSEWRSPIEIFGIEIVNPPVNLTRQFMVRFGDITRIEPHFRDVQVTLKSGTTFGLDRFSAGDIDDGVRVWDGTRGVVDLDARRIRVIEFLPTPSPFATLDRLYGTVRTRQGDFTGFIQWDQRDGIGADELDGRAADGERRLRYDTIRSVAHHSRDSALITLRDGREMVLSGTGDVGHRNRGIYVDDRRYGRVLISWDAFERVEFSPGGSGPAYGDFRPGRALAGIVTTRDGRRLAGRLIYDFDESETTETFDVSYQGVDYNIPFGMITSVAPRSRDERGAQSGRVTLADGEALRFDRNGDLGERNAGLLIFVDGRERPDLVPWTDVEQVDFDRSAAKVPPRDGR